MVPRSNAVLITDRGVKIERYLELLRQLDVRTGGESGLRTYVYPLKHASADELAATLSELFGVSVPAPAERSRVKALEDRSLSSELDAFRRRENSRSRSAARPRSRRSRHRSPRRHGARRAVTPRRPKARWAASWDRPPSSRTRHQFSGDPHRAAQLPGAPGDHQPAGHPAGAGASRGHDRRDPLSNATQYGVNWRLFTREIVSATRAGLPACRRPADH